MFEIAPPFGPTLLGGWTVSLQLCPRCLPSEHKQQALEALERDILAAPTNRTHDARLRTIGNALQMWGIPMWPPTPASWKALAATKKLGRYASAAVYFSTSRTAAERLGYVMEDFAIRSRGPACVASDLRPSPL